MKIFSRAFFMAVVLLLAACTSPKDQFVNSISEFNEQVKSEYQTYSSYDLQIVSEQYSAFRKEAELYVNEFTEHDKAIVDKCYRDLNEIIARCYVNNGITRVKGYFEEAVNLIKDLSGSTVSDIVDELNKEEEEE